MFKFLGSLLRPRRALEEILADVKSGWDLSHDLSGTAHLATVHTSARKTIVIFSHGTCVGLDSSTDPTGEALAILQLARRQLTDFHIEETPPQKALVTFRPEACFSIVTMDEFERAFLDPRKFYPSARTAESAFQNGAELMGLLAQSRLLRDAQNPEIAKIMVWPKPQQPMRVATMDYLLEQDRDNSWETPYGFDYEKEMAEIRTFGGELSRICDRELRLDGQVQDASYFAAWEAFEQKPRPGSEVLDFFWSGVFTIRFSSFGRMWSIFYCAEQHPISEEVHEALVDFLFSKGYVFVPENLTSLPYRDAAYPPSWGIRFFDYL